MIHPHHGSRPGSPRFALESIAERTTEGFEPTELA